MTQIDYSGRKTLNVNTNGVVTIPGRWILVGIAINTKAGSGGTAVIYDDATSATPANKKASLDTVNASIGMIRYEFPCFNGIYIVVGGGTAPDLTVIYEPTP